MRFAPFGICPDGHGHTVVDIVKTNDVRKHMGQCRSKNRNLGTAGWALRFPRVVLFSSSQFLRYGPETSGMCVTLLRAYNDIPHKSNSNGIMPN